MWPQSIWGHENCAAPTFMVYFLPWLRCRSWQIDVVAVMDSFPLWSIAERKGAKDDWLKREEGRGWWLGGCFRCLFSCFSEICVIAPVGWTLTVTHVHHSREVNSSEFQWPCWPRLFDFYGERGHQICNEIIKGYCHSAYPLPFSFFIVFSSRVNRWIIKLCGIIQFSSLWPSEDRTRFVFLAVGLFPRRCCKWQQNQTFMHFTLWTSRCCVVCLTQMQFDQIKHTH